VVRESLELREVRVLLALQDPSEDRVLRDHRDLRDLQELLDQQDQSDLQVQLDLLELADRD